MRTVLRILVVAALFYGFVRLLGTIGTVLRLLVIAGFLTVALNPVVVGLERRGLGRARATLLVFTALLLVLGVFLAVILTPLYTEVRAFAANIDTYVAELRESPFFSRLDRDYGIFERLQEQARTLPERLPATAGSLVGVAGAVVNAIFQTVSVLFLTLFLLLELPAITASIRSLLAPETEERTSRLAHDITQSVARYVAGNLVISLIAGTVTFVALLVLGVPYALVLALLMALFDLIPLVGATIGAVFVVLAAFTQGVVPGVVMIGVMVLYQQVENQVIQPLVYKRSVSVSPFIVLVAVLVGSTLLGVLGALLAIPVAASIQIALREVIEARRRHVQEERERPQPAPGTGD